MKVSAIFEDGRCALTLVPEGDWEQKLLGAVANGADQLNAMVEYKPEGHFSYGKCSAVKVRLEPPNVEAQGRERDGCDLEAKARQVLSAMKG